jgi:hypothetical protein
VGRNVQGDTLIGDVVMSSVPHDQDDREKQKHQKYKADDAERERENRRTSEDAYDAWKDESPAVRYPPGKTKGQEPCE